MKKSWYKWEVLGLLWVAFFLNQADRQIYNTLLGEILQSLQISSEQVTFLTIFQPFSFFTAVTSIVKRHQNLLDKCNFKKI